MKIGYVQFAPQLGNLQATLNKLDQLFKAHLRHGLVDLLVLPELCNSGYNFSSKIEAMATSENIYDSQFIKFLTEKSSQYNLHFVSGFNEREGDKLYNSAVLVGPPGHLGTYRKLHLFMNEQDFFEPGDVGLPIFDLGFCKLGILVCFDWVFPEVWRILALQGAEIIAHPANLVLPDFCQRAMPTHALVNHIYTITANRIGTEGDLNFTGRSTIVNPKGNVLLQAQADNETVGIVTIEITLAQDKGITPRNNLFVDRRVDIYSEFL